MKLKHYYHIYADGNWRAPFDEHILALNESGLMEALDEINVGIIGCDEHIEEVKLALPPKFVVVVEACRGYEQTTMETIDTSESAYILYAHTKGASNPDQLRVDWRRSMTNGTVYGWRTCIDALDKGYSAAGLYWQSAPQQHFSGTFWWATTDYLSQLPPQLHNTRFDAEMWIGKGPAGSLIADLCPGFISHSNYLKRPEGSLLPTFPGYITFQVNSRIAGYVKGRVYTLPKSQFLQNCVEKGHFSLISTDSNPIKTHVVRRSR